MRMKFNKVAGAAAGLVLAAGAAACNNDKITNLNNNPNAPTDAPAGPVFTNATRLSVSRFLGTQFGFRQTEVVAQQFAEQQYGEEDRYQRIDAGSTQGTFNSAYSGELEDLQKVIQKGDALKAPRISGPARVMKTWDFSYLTDTWGDIPYSEALQGDAATPILSPKYDAQKDIYADFFKVLQKASTDMQSPVVTDNLGSADPIYAGSFSKWQKFANSLHARLAMRLVNVDPTTANAELTAALTAPGGVFASNADNAALVWPGDGVYNNPWSDNLKTRDDNRISKTFFDLLQPTNDPRLKIFAQPYDTTGGVYKYAGLQNGLTNDASQALQGVTSRPGTIFYAGKTAYGTFGTSAGAKRPSYLMTYAELEFIRAEAAERGIAGQTGAAAHYNAAVTASMNQWGVTDAAVIAAYLAQPSVAYQSGVAGLKQIAQQLYVAQFGDGLQAWATWRRTCQPSTIKQGPDAVLDYVPRRFTYSITDQSANGTNQAAAVARQGPDLFSTRVYWDTKPMAAPTCQ